MSDKLTAKQRMFVAEYIVSLNATDAAKKAGYSERTAMEQGYQLLQKTSVQKALQEALNQREKRTGITADYVLNSLKQIADASMGAADYNPANKALELLGKHLKLFTDKIEADVKGTLEINVNITDE
jgi:phage terminase small subunit